jgi:hypothetical protein
MAFIRDEYGTDIPLIRKSNICRRPQGLFDDYSGLALEVVKAQIKTAANRLSPVALPMRFTLKR